MPDTTTSPVTEPSPQPAETGAPPADMVAKVAELNQRIVGFQTALNRKTQEAQAAIDSASAFASQIGTLTQERDRLAQETSAARDDLERMRAIAKYPALFADEEQNLLRRDLKGQDFINFIETYRKRLDDAAAQNSARNAAGSAPAAGSTRQGAGQTREALMTQLRSAQRKGDQSGVDEAYRLLHTLQNKR